MKWCAIEPVGTTQEMTEGLSRDASSRQPRRAALCVVGTGIQWGGQTTLAARVAIEKAESVLFAVANAWTARWIRELNPRATSLSYPRDGRPRRAIYDEMVERILSELQQYQRVCAVFYGSPAVFTQPAHAAVRRARQAGHDACMVPGVSFLDCLFSDLGIDPGDGGCQVHEARTFLVRAYAIEPRAHLILSQVALATVRTTFMKDDPRTARGLSAIAERLCGPFPPDHEVVVYEAATHPLHQPRTERVRLDQLAMVHVSEVSTLWVPPLAARPALAKPATSPNEARPQEASDDDETQPNPAAIATFRTPTNRQVSDPSPARRVVQSGRSDRRTAEDERGP